jgi:hypothetical protein
VPAPFATLLISLGVPLLPGMLENAIATGEVLDTTYRGGAPVVSYSIQYSVIG